AAAGQLRGQNAAGSYGNDRTRWLDEHRRGTGGDAHSRRIRRFIAGRDLNAAGERRRAGSRHRLTGAPGATVAAMTDSRFHLAQINVGRLLAPIDDDRIAGFVEALEPINRLAEARPGYGWRHQSDAGTATDILLTDDAFLI